MISLDDFLAELKERDPKLEERLEEARAELRLGLLIYELREARGWTQRELAHRAKMPQSAVARYEKAGRTPSVTTLWRFAQALNVSFVLGPDMSVAAVERDPDADMAKRITRKGGPSSRPRKPHPAEGPDHAASLPAPGTSSAMGS